MKANILLAFALITALSTLSCSDKTTQEKQATAVIPASSVSGKEFAAKLDELGYFKYVNPKDVQALKDTITKDFDPGASPVTIWDNETGIPKDYRLYMCDGETLFEAGGFTSMLTELQPAFDKIGLKMTVTNHTEEWDTKTNSLNHSITINGNNYTIFKNFKETGWGEAAQTFADIINTELTLQKKEDRVYLIHGGNEGSIIFLNEKQFKYMYSVFTDKEWKPLSVKEWCKVMDVKPLKIN
ncbi:MAG: hypothetical protein DI539_11125 [Flavobacterium psychrophilum]|nr:MAG: hypothetical protein DI539_11125 [Flavobacterium psychrophilum]